MGESLNSPFTLGTRASLGVPVGNPALLLSQPAQRTAKPPEPPLHSFHRQVQSLQTMKTQTYFFPDWKKESEPSWPAEPAHRCVSSE